ncbi:restriction endonuclease, partial [bacterium]|nr:restriction endonuclease [bacterium]
MKTLTLNIENVEDIEYLESINYDNKVLNTALTIGLKSIQMSQTNMTGNSYIEPLRQIIIENNIENGENIKKIDNMLCDLLNIKNNSSRKGKLGESLAMNSLKKKYPDWTIENTTGTAHESDIFAYSENYGKILYEIKTYSSNVPSKEIQKFKDDMVTTNSKYGIFVSQTSGIVGKKLIDYEVIDNSILVYISSSGLNGHGIEIGTEFLLSLIDSGYLDKRHLLKNDNVRDVLYEINESMFELNECINNFSRIKMQIIEHRNMMNRSIDTMYRNVIEYDTRANIIYKNLIKTIKMYKPVNVSLLEQNIDISVLIDTSVLNMNNLMYFK